VSTVTSPIISPEELVVRLADPQLRIADVRWYLGQPHRGRDEYAAGHLPGAIFVSIDDDLTTPDGPGRHPLPLPVEFAGRLAQLGIGDEHEVVAYDDDGGTIAARLWWMLDDLGHRAIRVLDGGFGAWIAAGLPVSTMVPAFPAATLRLAEHWSKIVERPALREWLGSVTLLDARAPERYRGEIEPIDPVAGHIPTARSAPTGGNLGPDGRFRAAAELASRFADLGSGSDADRPTVTSCGSGITACHNALAMRVAGLPDPLLYPGSYSDWSSSGEPVATGPEPGTPPAR
jgi:thiosulfate/3-mercaptopyruvate sulfurtransferase